MSLRAHDVTAGHDGSPVLTGVEFTVVPGRITGLTGPSGGGKTTLARVLAGLHTPSAGHVTLDDAPLPAAPGGEIAVLYQSPRQAVTPRWTLARIIAEPLRHRRGERTDTVRAAAVRAAVRADTVRTDTVRTDTVRTDTVRTAAVRAAAVRVGLTDDLLDRRPHQVSDGQLQRACLARALVQRPRYLICDEMTAMLDPATTAALTAVVTEQARDGLGVLAISHHLALLEVWADERFALDGTGITTLP